MCHYLTQNSKIRALLYLIADLLQMAIMYYLELVKLVYPVLYFLFDCFNFPIYPDMSLKNACAKVDCTLDQAVLFLTLKFVQLFAKYSININVLI